VAPEGSGGLALQEHEEDADMAKTTCMMVMPMRKWAQSGFGSRRLLMTIAMEIFGKLKSLFSIDRIQGG
jgi:hypothetical protein